MSVAYDMHWKCNGIRKGEKTTHRMWESTENHISDKEFASRIYKELLQLHNKKHKKPNKKLSKNLHRHFSKEDKQMVHIRRKRCSTSFLIREMHIPNHNDRLLHT